MQNPSTAPRFAGILLLLCLLGCHTSEIIPGATACRHGATAALTSGTTPTITWTPGCTVGYIHIADSTGYPSWIVIDSGTAGPLNALKSGIQYGVVPPEGRGFGLAAQPLKAGALYLLALRLASIGGNGRLVDTLWFRP